MLVYAMMSLSHVAFIASSLFIALQWLNREAEQAIPQKRPQLRRLDFGLLADALPSKPFLLDLTGWTETPSEKAAAKISRS